LINAAQAIDEGDPKGNEIRVRVWHSADEVCAEVKDTGKGIDPADLPYVFEPFFTTKDRGVGTGLGLYISNNIVNSLSGRIDVESTVGRGTRFVVCVPAADSQTALSNDTLEDRRAMQREIVSEHEQTSYE
jgi:signal transduction histidine kinase